MSEPSRKPLFVRDGRFHWTPGNWKGWVLAFSPGVVALLGVGLTLLVLDSAHGDRWFVRDGPHHWSPTTWQGWLLTLGPAGLAVAIAAVMVVLIATRYRRGRDS